MKWTIILLLIATVVVPLHSNLEFTEESPMTVQPAGSPVLAPVSSNWAATDGAGRKLPMYGEVGKYKPNKYVGIFYFLLHGQYNDKAVYDISTLLKKTPTSPKFGPETAWHWWGEPEVGYFKADDPWVLRRNLQLLTLAGIDILFFDVTNGDAYMPVVTKLCDISVDMRHNGISTPYICFVTYTKGAQTATTVYQQFYTKNKYSELWFRWQGKPLMLGNAAEVTDPTVKNFFTWRYSWAWTNARNEPHHWQWIDRTPQNYGWDKNPSVAEQIPVSVASHPFDNGIGKSFQKGKQKPVNRLGVTSFTPQGLYFDEQWKRALQVDPAVVFVAGWNEWIAQRFVNRPDSAARAKPYKFMGKPMKPGQTYFVDLYNQEYNRDIDPMKGGYTDNYYYQLVANVRRFKGIPAPEPASPPQTIPIDGSYKEWEKIRPEFVDLTGDVAHRNWPRADNAVVYKNSTGRNDFHLCKVTRDARNLYFYVRTAKTITLSTGKNWMLLFIDSDQSAKTGWSGYDYLINQTVKGNKSTVSKWDGKQWKALSSATIRYSGIELELSVPLSSLGLKAGKVNIDFHWADNIQRLNVLTEFFLHGDSAPDRRFNYRYRSL